MGRNGAGKTTLTRMLAGEGVTSEVIEHTGQVVRGGEIGYLPRDTYTGDPEQIARDRILAARDIDTTIRRIRKAEAEMSNTEGTRQIKAMERYVRLDHEFTAAGGWAANAEAAQMAALPSACPNAFWIRRWALSRWPAPPRGTGPHPLFAGRNALAR